MANQRGGVGVGVVNGYLYALGGHDAPASNPLASHFDSVERLVNSTSHPV
jgi:kelch-like protein 1/4/5